METSRRLAELPRFLFAELARKRAQAAARGVDVITLTRGDPDLPTPEPIVRAMEAALQEPRHQHYGSSLGERGLREAVARWYRRRFAVELDPETEVAVLIGSKEGLAHLPLVLADPGDRVLVPDPCYPVYFAAARLAGARAVSLPLSPANRFLAEPWSLPKEEAYGAKLLFLNYPNNPTGAVADLGYFRRIADWASRHRVWVAHDAAYAELAFSGEHPSFLQVPGAKELGVEFGSLSKSYCMTGWRIGFVAGNAAAVGGLVRLKENIDTGAFGAVQEAAAWALDHGDALAASHRRVFAARWRLFARGLREAGWEVAENPATIFAWARPPVPEPSMACAERLLEQAHVLASPGGGFGEGGEGWLRFALTESEERLEEALRRIARLPRPARA